MIDKTTGLNLSIFGSSGVGQFGIIPLRVQADNGTYIPHETTWDASLYGPDLINSVVPNQLNVNIADFSVNKYDYHYGINNGKNYINYDIQSNWYVDNIDISDDIAVVGMKDWVSTEKYTSQYSSTDALISCDNFYNVQINKSDPTVSRPGCSFHTYSVRVQGISLSIGETWDIKYKSCDGSNQTLTVNVTNGYDNTFTIESITAITYSIHNGGPYDPEGYVTITVTDLGSTYYPPYYGCGAGTYVKTDPITGSPKCYSNYCYPVDIGMQKTITYINIKNLVNIFQKPEFLNNRPADNNNLNGYNLQSNSPVGIYWTAQEFSDYSDVYLKVNYSRGATLSDSIVLLNSDTSDYLYTFGGFLSVSDYMAKCETLVRSNLPFVTNDALQDSEGYKWYIVYRETSGDYLFITLSSYIIPSSIGLSATIGSQDLSDPYTPNVPAISRYTKIFNQPSDDGSFLDPLTDGLFLFQNNEIYFDNIDVIKIANYPACGKVDIYTKKMGAITAASGNTITSSGHNLITGDQIKITCGLGSSSGITNINGFRYISGVNADKFNIYFDSGLTTPVSTSGLRTVSGVQWVAIGGSAWNYQHTLYSPNGKNGYGFIPQLRTVVESGTGQTLLSRAIETDIYEPTTSLQIPQSYLNSWISWTNFYPFQRLGSDPNAVESLDNGNKFGSDCRIQKLNDNQYIVSVSEPGAEVSFKIFDDYIIQQQTNKNPQNVLPTPQNKFITPTYLPYGKVHFYKITKHPYSIEYINSTGVANNPWSSYESLNQSYRIGGKIDNYPINLSTVKNVYNNTADNYWLGARYYSWNKVYNFDPTYGIEMPDQTSYPNEYGFVDSFGKSAVFSIQNSGIYCAASTNVKNAGFTTNTRMKYVDATSKTFKYNLQTNSFSDMSGIVNQTNYMTSRASDQISELQNYGLSLDFFNGNLYIGWSATYRGQEYLYIYNNSGINYNLAQTITSLGNNGFGNYFAVDKNFIVADSISTVDDSGNSTQGLSYLNIYQLDPIFGQFYYSHRISPTIDIGKYSSINPSLYALTSNLSYDGTSDSSATYTIDLYGKYDICNNSIVLRDYYEYAFFTYDGLTKKFKCRNHHRILNDSNNSDMGVIRMQPSSASFIGSSNGKFIDSLEVLDGFDNVSNTRIISTSYENKKILPLMIKVIEGVSNTGMYLHTHGKATYSSGINLYTQGPMPFNTGLNLFAKQPDVYQSGMNLFMKEYDISDANMNLFIRNQKIDENLTLVINPRFNNYFPLTMKTFQNTKVDENGNIVETDETFKTITTQDNFGSLGLIMDSHYTGVPNSSGWFNLSLKTRPYDDYGQGVNLTINYPLPESSGSLDLILNNPSGKSFTDLDLFIYGPDVFTATQASGSMNLFIHRIIEATMPLTVYNTYSSGGLNMYTRGAYINSSGINLFTSGQVYPTQYNDSQPLYVRGTRL
jgi:hypothetical protein